ncbi:MAG: ribonuclease H-like domain-containing protein [Akkermansiaceae bacterium]|nr:ribonuclease H-like domain-containing protein [Akkermansiaceae bacterium]
MNIVYFDLETRRSAAEVGGWHETGKMGVSVAVTYSTAAGAYHIYTEDQAGELIAELQGADLVVGYNHVGFDYGVLQPFTFWDIKEITRNLDLCTYLSERIGHRLKLDSVATASLGHSKTADGIQALKWWAEYEKTGNVEKLMEIARYCCYDVKVTMAVHRFGMKNGFVRYDDKNGDIITQPVDWDRLTPA